MDRWTHGPMDPWTHGPMDLRTKRKGGPLYPGRPFRLARLRRAYWRMAPEAGAPDWVAAIGAVSQ